MFRQHSLQVSGSYGGLHLLIQILVSARLELNPGWRSTFRCRVSTYTPEVCRPYRHIDLGCLGKVGIIRASTAALPHYCSRKNAYAHVPDYEKLR